MNPSRAFPSWFDRQSLKSVRVPDYSPESHRMALDLLGDELVRDRTIASGKLGAALERLTDDPTVTHTQIAEEIFNGNSGYNLQVLWPLAALFAAKMPRRISSSTAKSYVGWLDRVRRIVLRDLSTEQSQAVEAVLDEVSDAFVQAAGRAAGLGEDASREAEAASERVDTSQPGIYVFTTPTYLAYPPFGFPDDLARQDFRYLKTGSTSVDVSGRIHGEIGRQTGLPEPYIIVAKFTCSESDVDYLLKERQIHLLLGAARHGPEEDGTRRSRSRGAGTEWFITRLPFVIAVAESLGLQLSLDADYRETMNERFQECDLPDWMFF